MEEFLNLSENFLEFETFLENEELEEEYKKAEACSKDRMNESEEDDIIDDEEIISEFDDNLIDETEIDDIIDDYENYSEDCDLDFDLDADALLEAEIEIDAHLFSEDIELEDMDGGDLFDYFC